jgi:hypothetical protein
MSPQVSNYVQNIKLLTALEPCDIYMQLQILKLDSSTLQTNKNVFL